MLPLLVLVYLAVAMEVQPFTSGGLKLSHAYCHATGEDTV